MTSGASGTQQLPVLMYHGVGPSDPGAWSGLTVPAERFAAHVAWLSRHGYSTIGASDCASFVRGEGTLPARAVMLTFDDGYANLLEHALPILVRHGMTATVFVVTDRIGDRSAWDEAAGMTPVPLMSADDIRAWAARGIGFGSHTRTHPYLSSLDDARVEDEVAGSRRDLESLLQQPVEAFAYPYGATSPAAYAAVSRTYSVAFTVVETLTVPHTDPHLVPRTNVLPNDRPIDLRLSLSLGYSPRSRVRMWAGKQRRRFWSTAQ